ncbi:MAG TPA: hypothetical protein VFK29_01510, partial [Rhodanobacteraceae bacterium]|nr:hypothetical protein [Rhodanobacteraceae bacterium]
QIHTESRSVHLGLLLSHPLELHHSTSMARLAMPIDRGEESMTIIPGPLVRSRSGSRGARPE